MDTRDSTLPASAARSTALHRFFSAWLVAVLVWSSMSPAAFAKPEVEPPATTESLGKLRKAPVIVDGEVLFYVAGISAYPADRRAREIAEGIASLADDPAFDPESLHVVEENGTTIIVTGTARPLRLFDADAELEGVDRSTLARAYVARMREAVVTYRQVRTPEALTRSGLYIVAATVALALFFWLARIVMRRLDTLMERRLRARFKDLEHQSFKLVRAKQLWHALKGARSLLWLTAAAFIVFGYLQFVLAQLPWTKAIGNRIFALVIDPLRVIGGGILDAIPNLVFLAILVIFLRYALKVMQLFFVGVADAAIRLPGFEPDWAWPTYRLVRIGVVAFALAMAFPYIPGSGSEAFRGITVLLAFVLSLGSTSVIANLIAGYSMVYRRAFKLGDRIQIGEHLGDVTEARLLVTHLRTVKNEEIVVPNSLLLNSSVTNYSTLARNGELVLHTTVGIGYETPWRQVEAMLLLAAERTEGVQETPAPYVLQKGLGDFCVTYEINVFCNNAQQMDRIYTALEQNILDVFNENGVQIMTPAYRADPAEPKVVPKERWFEPPARPPSKP